MKRSTKVAAPLLAAAALAMMAGCRKPEMQRCVDEKNKVVDDSLCANQPAQGNQQYQNLGGGRYAPSVGRSYTTRSGVTTRGGFGSSFSSGGSQSSGAGE